MTTTPTRNAAHDILAASRAQRLMAAGGALMVTLTVLVSVQGLAATDRAAELAQQMRSTPVAATGLAPQA